VPHVHHRVSGVHALAAQFEAAAGLLLPFAPEEAASVRHTAAGCLYDDGLRMGGTGLARAIELCRRNEAIWTRATHPEDWVKTQICLGLTLTDQAGRTEGAAGAALLADAVAAYRATLEVFTRAMYPADWAMTQISLGYALLAHADRTVARQSG